MSVLKESCDATPSDNEYPHNINKNNTDMNFSLFEQSSPTNRYYFPFDRQVAKLVNEYIKDQSIHYYTFINFNIIPTHTKKLIDIFSNIGNVIFHGNRTTIFKIPNGFIIMGTSSDVFSKDSETSIICFNMYSDSFENLESIYNLVNEVLQPFISSLDRYIHVDWVYIDSIAGLKKIVLSDKISDTFFKEAYPYLNVERLTEDYLKSNEPIIVLMGPPGTGKTRLIRYIMNITANMKDFNIHTIYSSDQRAIQDGNIFIDFVSSEKYDFMVLEDIDYHLTSRKDGNTAMYNFLSISNGLVVNQQEEKKIILSTNLPNVSNIDPALLRPGRCFSIINTRELYYDESLALLNKLEIDKQLIPKKSYTLGELYNTTNKNYNLDKQQKQNSTGFV